MAELLSRCALGATTGPITCAVSGGPDSTALLVLAVATGRAVTAVHVDHGHRAESQAEAALVEGVARRLGATFVSETVDVPDGPNLEERWRDARRDRLPADTMWGHTADDQAETVLLALIRGAGVSGLAGIPAAGHPILALRRFETVLLCATLGLTVVTDPSNSDPRFRRNRIRHEVLPLLVDIADRDVVPLLVRSAGINRELDDWLNDEAAQLLLSGGSDDDSGPRAVGAERTVDAAVLRSAPRPVAVAAIRAWWREVTGSAHPPDSAAVGRILDVADQRAVSADVVGGWRVARTGDRLRLIGRPRPPVPGDSADR